jgi:putative chitinase
VTPEQLQHLYGCSAERAAAYCAPLHAAMQRFGIDNPNRICAFLAQVGHESARLVYVEEIDSGVAYNGRADLGNTRPEALQWSRGNPGPWFKGHGLMQITGYDNHAACGAALHPDDPEIFLREPRALCQAGDAALSAAWFWSECKHLNPLADAGEFEQITRRINGGLNGQADRLLLWGRAREMLAAAAQESRP